jgi:sulfur-oxidizing protein SoxA
MKRLLLVLLLAGCAVKPPPDTRRSGFDFMSPATQAMQKNDAENPAMLWIADGEAIWNRADGETSCASCHGDAMTSMRGVAASYPAFDKASQQPVSLVQRINLCRKNNQRANAFAFESAELLSLESYVAMQSRGMPITPSDDANLDAARERGKALFNQRTGQLDLSCAECHDHNAGKRLAGNVIPEAHPTGYPIYRLEWQGVGSLHRRMRNCMNGVRAEPYALGARELVELELYLASRAKGMMLETPGVRP